MINLEHESARLRVERQLLAETIAHDVDPHGDAADEADSRSRRNQLEDLDLRIEHLVHLDQERRRQPVPPADEVGAGTEVTLRFEDGAVDVVQVVQSILEVDRRDIGLTLSSPLGLALRGARVGEQVEYEAPSGPTTVEVVAIRLSRVDVAA